MSYFTPPAVLSALGLTTYEPAAGSGSFLINPPFAMTESPPNTLCHTIYADRMIGLTVTAWPNPQPGRGGWLVRFLRRNTQRKLLDQTAEWRGAGSWNRFSRWDPIRHHLIPPAALAAVEAWLVERAVEVAS